MPADASLELLLDALLYEGYALYPYTASATKNATPTPFGIVYPPAYAAGSPTAHDRLRLQGIALAGPAAVVDAEVRFLREGPGGDKRAVEGRVAVEPRPLATLAAEPHVATFDFDGLTGRLRLWAGELRPGVWRVVLCVHNTTPAEVAGDRAAALRHSLLSTHPLMCLDSGTFASPLEQPGESVNTYPVLATEADDVLLGAAIVLPDHPRLAPESGGSLFDGTEIEEALVLHVLALSDGERDEIAAADPAVREMIERVASVAPAELWALHGRTLLTDVEER